MEEQKQLSAAEPESIQDRLAADELDIAEIRQELAAAEPEPTPAAEPAAPAAEPPPPAPQPDPKPTPATSDPAPVAETPAPEAAAAVAAAPAPVLPNKRVTLEYERPAPKLQAAHGHQQDANIARYAQGVAGIHQTAIVTPSTTAGDLLRLVNFSPDRWRLHLKNSEELCPDSAVYTMVSNGDVLPITRNEQ